jgi:hypothetical protein
MAERRADRNRGERPDSEAFQAVLDKGIAPADVVFAAYDRALAEHNEGKPYRQLLEEAFSDGGVVQERPVIDPGESPSFDGQHVRRKRDQQWKGRD